MKVKPIIAAAAKANWPQAPRENDRNKAASIISSMRVLRMTRRPASMRWNTSSPGSTRNAPSTLGSLNVPRARPYSTNMSDAPPSRRK